MFMNSPSQFYLECSEHWVNTHPWLVPLPLSSSAFLARVRRWSCLMTWWSSWAGSRGFGNWPQKWASPPCQPLRPHMRWTRHCQQQQVLLNGQLHTRVIFSRQIKRSLSHRKQTYSHPHPTPRVRSQITNSFDLKFKFKFKCNFLAPLSRVQESLHTS